MLVLRNVALRVVKYETLAQQQQFKTLELLNKLSQALSPLFSPPGSTDTWLRHGWVSLLSAHSGCTVHASIPANRLHNNKRTICRSEADNKLTKLVTAKCPVLSYRIVITLITPWKLSILRICAQEARKTA